MRYIATLIALVAVAGVASAAVEPTLTYTTGGVTGYNTTDISIDIAATFLDVNSVECSNDWTSAKLIVTPGTTGQVFQDDLFGTGSMIPWGSGQIGYQPSLAYDTIITDSVLVDRTRPGTIATLGASGEEGSVAVFDLDELELYWYTSNTDDIGAMYMARVTLANIATGTWEFEAFDASSAEVSVVTQTGAIVDGFLVPEPATMLIMAIGGIGVLARRRRK